MTKLCRKHEVRKSTSLAWEFHPRQTHPNKQIQNRSQQGRRQTMTNCILWHCHPIKSRLVLHHHRQQPSLDHHIGNPYWSTTNDGCRTIANRCFYQTTIKCEPWKTTFEEPCCSDCLDSALCKTTIVDRSCHTDRLDSALRLFISLASSRNATIKPNPG